ncbi:MAG: phage holin family protein [Actinomycetota bacterium]
MTDRVRNEDLYRGNGAVPDKSAGQLVKEVTEDISTLVRKEIELAKQELGQSVTAKVKGAAIFAIVGALAFFMLIFLLLALRDGFHELWAAWIADLATVGVLVIVAIVCALVAKKMISTPIKTDLTKKNLKEDVDLVKSLGRR